MKIKELNIIEFGGLTDRHYELSGGLNIFEGNNETGKSTLWSFIKFMLYGIPKKGHPERERSVNRMSHRAAGTMTVVYGTDEYRIERSFSENSRGRVATYRVSDGERVFSGEEPGEAMLGVPRDVFENSVAIGQSSCAGLGGEKGAAAIRNLLSSADENVDVEKIQKKLNAIRVSYSYVNGKGGRLYELSQMISSLETQLERAFETQLKISDIETRLARNTENMLKSEKDLEVAQEVTDRLSKCEMLKRFDRLTDNKEKRDRIIDERDRLIQNETRNGYTPTAADGACLSSLADSYERAEKSLLDVEKRMKELSEHSFGEKELCLADIGELVERNGGADAVISSAVKANKKKKNGIIFIAAIGAPMMAVFIPLTFAFNKLFLIGAAVGLIVAVIGIVLSIKGASEEKAGVLEKIPHKENTAVYIKKCADALRARRSHDTSLMEATAEKSSCRLHCEHILSDIGKMLERIAPDTLADANGARAEADRIQRFVAFKEELNVRIESLNAVISSDEAVLSVYDEDELRASMDGVEIPSVSLKDAENGKRFHSERLRILKNKDTELRTELINLKAIGDDPTVIKEELSVQKKLYEDAERYYEALLGAMDGIQKAADHMQGSMTPAIGKDACELISKISGGRYGGVNMGNSLELSLVGDDGMTTTTEMMSGGMKDAAYLALRISLMKKIYDSEIPPLMMDEALCQLDNERVMRVLEILAKLCADGCQCLLFTCHDRERRVCDELGVGAECFMM